MKTFSINTLGCKVNQYESQQIRQLLEESGLKPASRAQVADIFVINTCCITKTASAKSRRHIRKALSKNPALAVIVVGCLTAADTDELDIDDKKVLIVRKPEQLPDRIRHLTAIGPEGNISSSFDKNISFFPDSNPCSDELDLPASSHTVNYLPPLKAFEGHTRAFLKVQDGCDGYCSYCIIPKTRPLVHSRSSDEIIFEAKSLVKSGHCEIVVSGVFLGAYGASTVHRRKWSNQNKGKLPQLLAQLAQIKGLRRIRLSSLEPADVTDQLLDVMAKHHNIMPHLHLSLQSGSDSILRRMCRRYEVNEFLKKVSHARQALESPAITTDLIVGFPGETDEDFEQTVKIARIVNFAKMHIFPFSPRKGTAASKMKDKVDSRIIRRRAEELGLLDRQLQSRFRERFIGKKAHVLIEQTKTLFKGRTERYFEVAIKDSGIEKGQIVPVVITENTENHAIGQIIKSEFD